MGGLIQDVKDPILVKLRAGVESKLDPSLKEGYQRIVVAGMKLLFSPQTQHLMVDALTQARQSGNVPAGVIQGVTRLMTQLVNESKGKLSVPAAFPAAITLMTYILEFATTALKVPIDNNMVAGMTHGVTMGLLKLFKIDQAKLAQGIDYARQQVKGGAPSVTPSSGPPALTQGAA